MKISNCIICKSPLGKNETKFCSNKCQGEYKRNEIVYLWKMGTLTALNKGESLRPSIRDFILKKYNYKCAICFWGEINPFSKRIPLEINHIDGNYLNNKERKIHK